LSSFKLFNWQIYFFSSRLFVHAVAKMALLQAEASACVLVCSSSNFAVKSGEN